MFSANDMRILSEQQQKKNEKDRLEVAVPQQLEDLEKSITREAGKGLRHLDVSVFVYPEVIEALKARGFSFVALTFGIRVQW